VPLKSGTGTVTGPSFPPALAAGAPAIAIPTMNTNENMNRRIVEPPRVDCEAVRPYSIETIGTIRCPFASPPVVDRLGWS
jgi:hypothetical protein